MRPRKRFTTRIVPIQYLSNQNKLLRHNINKKNQNLKHLKGVKTIPRRGGRHYVLVKGAEDAMEAFRMEGQIGGTMVRRIQAAGEFEIMKRFKTVRLA